VLRVRVLTSILYSPWKAPFPTAGISKKPTARNRRSSLPRDHPLLRAVIRLARRSERPRDLLFLSLLADTPPDQQTVAAPFGVKGASFDLDPRQSSKWGTRAGASKHRANKQPTVIPTEVAAFLLFLASRSPGHAAAQRRNPSAGVAFFLIEKTSGFSHERRWADQATVTTQAAESHNTNLPRSPAPRVL
jgi:hypothetical protein